MNRKQRRDMDRAFKRADKRGKTGKWVPTADLEAAEKRELIRELDIRSATIQAFIDEKS